MFIHLRFRHACGCLLEDIRVFDYEVLEFDAFLLVLSDRL